MIFFYLKRFILCFLKTTLFLLIDDLSNVLLFLCIALHHLTVYLCCNVPADDLNPSALKKKNTKQTIMYWELCEKIYASWWQILLLLLSFRIASRPYSWCTERVRTRQWPGTKQIFLIFYKRRLGYWFLCTGKWTNKNRAGYEKIERRLL